MHPCPTSPTSTFNRCTTCLGGWSPGPDPHPHPHQHPRMRLRLLHPHAHPRPHSHPHAKAPTHAHPHPHPHSYPHPQGGGATPRVLGRQLRPPPQGFFRIIKNQGGGDPSPKSPSPPPQTKVTIVGKSEIYNREIWSGHFWYTKFWVQNPLPPSPPPCSKEALPRPPPPGGLRPTVSCQLCRPQESMGAEGVRCFMGTKGARRKW